MINQLSGLPALDFANIDALYHPCCDHNLQPLAADDGLDKLIEQMTRLVYEELGLPVGLINTEVVAAYADKFLKGMLQGYGETTLPVDYTTADTIMLQALERNVWQFSSAKNYTQLVQLSKALIDENGNLRSYRAFKQAAMDVNNKFVNQWLQAEYNLAVAGGQMSSKWVNIQNNAATLPYLEFDAVLDKQTSELCRGLNGTVLPVNHPFWNTYYPPNHFNCRSTVRQRSYGPATKDVPSAEIPDMFKTNLGNEGLIFPKGHAYFDGVPDEVLQQATWLMHNKQNG